jgi:anti-sigma-K factor RskA
MSSEVEVHVIELLPAFVLDALTDAETGQVAEHLAGCQTCQAELARLQLVADDLPLALTQTTPPPRVKDALMRAIRTPQQRVDHTTQPTLWRQLVGLIRQPLPALGVALIMLMAIGNLILWRQLSLTGQQTNSSMRIVALANTQDAPGAAGTLIMDQKGDFGTLVVDNLAMLASSQQYQVWLIKDGERISGGVFSVNPEGYASQEIIASIPLVQYDSIGITIEPYGGSPGPTGAKVLGSAIPH